MQIAAIGTIIPNPTNPRIIKDDKFKKLVKSIQEFPQMLELRPIVVDSNMVVLGGNMRLKACIAAGLKEVPIIVADQLTDEQKGEFIIKDNVGFGEWDWDLLANEWDVEALTDWGLDLPILMDEPSYEDLIGEDKSKPATMKITFYSPEQLQKAEIDIQELLDRKYQGAYFSVSAGEI
jgi:ParB-like chromosome segregation protein Spo0J